MAAVRPGQGSEETRNKNRTLCETQVIPKLGERKIRQLRAEEVDLWLEGLAKTLATSTLQLVRSLLSRVVNRAMKRGMVDRNVVELCQPPTGLDGRPSKSLTFEQVNDVLTLTEGDPLHCYIVVSLLTGARTEEVRALTWRHVHLDDDPAHSKCGDRSDAAGHQDRQVAADTGAPCAGRREDADSP